MNCSEFKQMLDLYIDGQLNDSQISDLRAHAAQCCECQGELKAAEQLRGILSHMDDDISVPLPAQAAWRNAIRAEAKRKRMKKIYSFCGAAAAVCVLTVGISAMLGQNNPASLAPAAVRVETDGVAQNARLEEGIALTSVVTRGMEYINRTIETEDPPKAYDYLCDVITEYGGMIEHEANGDDKKVFVQIPGDSIVDFISAVDSLGSADAENQAIAVDESSASVGVCVTITTEHISGGE